MSALSRVRERTRRRTAERDEMSRHAEIAAAESLVCTFDRIAREYTLEGNRDKATETRAKADWWRQRIAMWRQWRIEDAQRSAA